MAFPSYSDIWQNLQSGHFDVAAHAAIAKAELSREQSYHYVTDAFADYAKGYRDHQYTYHYSEIKRQLIEPQLGRLRGNDTPPARAVRYLLEFLKAELDANNANDCVDLAGWKVAAGQAAKVVQDGMNAVSEELCSQSWPGIEYQGFLEGLQKWFQSSSLFYKAIYAYADYLESIDGMKWSNSEERCRALFEYLEETAKDLEEAYGDQDSASEIRSHLRFSRRIVEVTAGLEHLYLEGVEASWLFPFNFPHQDVKELFARLEHAQDIGTDSLQIHRGRLIDIIETSYGREGFKHALVVDKRFRSLELTVGGIHFRCDLALHVYDNGIAVLRVSAKLPERIDVLRARLLLGLSYPFLSGEYKVSLRGEGSHDFRNIREAAEAIADRIYANLSNAIEALEQSGGEREYARKAEPLHELDWFSCLVVDRVILGKATVLSFAEIQSHPELKALYFPIREARASYYDWAAFEDQAMENLARIRSHPSDIFFMSGNQAFLYFRDDPFWAVLEYRHTLDQTFMLKSWVISLHRKVDETLKRTREAGEGTHEPPRKLNRQIEHLRGVLGDIAAVRRDTVSALNLISNSAVSLYPDHATLLRRIHAVRELPDLLELLERKVRNLGESESSLLTSLETREGRKRALVEGFVQGALAVIGLLTILTAGLQLLQLKVGEGFGAFVGIWNFWYGRQTTIDPAIFRDASLFIIQLVIIFVLVVGIILLALLKRRR